MRTFLRDLRFGIRVLCGAPSFTIAAVLTLALGISATSTVFTWMDAILFHPFFGVEEPGRLAVLEMSTRDAPNGGHWMSAPDWQDYNARMSTAQGIALHRAGALALGEAEQAQLAWGELVSANYFDILRVKARLGRTFTAEEGGQSRGAFPVVVISERAWRKHFRGDPNVCGKTAKLNGRVLTVVGVTAEAFHGTVGGMVYDFWIPLSMGPALNLVSAEDLERRDAHGFQALVRLAGSATVAQASAEAASIAANLASTYPKTNQKVTAAVLPLWAAHDGAGELLLQPLRILMAVAVLVLLIVCANVANLLLARSVARRREFGIRLAIGAARWRLARQMLTETLLLAAAGAFLGVPLLFWMQEWLPSLVPDVGLPVQVAGAGYNWRIFGFTVLVCVAATFISGLGPALFCFRADVNEALKAGGGRSGTPDRATHRLRNTLVVAEVALAVVALAGAGLFARSFERLRSVHPGFNMANVLFGRFFVESTGFTGERTQRFCRDLRQELEASPGVVAAAYSDFTPLSTTAFAYATVAVDGYTPAQGEEMTVNRSLVSPGYFHTLQIPMLKGREFTYADTPETQPVIIVNEAFARRYWAGGDPLGRRVRAYGQDFTVVGLARDSKYFSPAEAPRPFLYLAFTQQYGRSQEISLFVRSEREPGKTAPVLRRAVAAVAPVSTAYHAVPLSEYTQVSTFGAHAAASFLAALGMMALLLAAVGLYGVMSYAVNQRTQEIGIRIAMGAAPGNIVRMLMHQGMVLTALGLAAGTALALIAARGVAGMLFGVGTADPTTFAAAAVFLSAVALLATWLPARRATRVEPVNALRRE